jgi:uncharacterized protein (TIGR02231 family)
MKQLVVLTYMACVWCVGVAFGQEPPPMVEAAPINVEARPRAVTVYLGRASVMRTAALELNPGVYDLTFANLPEAIQPQSLQARAEGSVKVLGVDYSQQRTSESSSPELAKLDSEIEAVHNKLKELADRRELLESQQEFLDAVSVRATTDASHDGGTDRLDLDAIRKQMGFVAGEREKLLESRRTLDHQRGELDKELQVLEAKRNAMAGAGDISRTAVVAVVVIESTPVRIDLTYLVSNATWEPSYNIRAALGGSTVQIEYDALLTQRTGEDWDDVRLTLSTAQPTVAANPPALTPWFVDVLRPQESPASVAGTPRAPSVARMDAAILGEPAVDGDDLAKLAADAAVAGSGPSVTYQLPRPVTVRTSSEKQQRTRISTIDTNPRFVHVAMPVLTEAVYIRGDLTNASVYQLLSGRASIFVGQDYVGPTALESVSPGGEFKVFFGIDHSVRATRQLVSKKTENTGLLGGGRRTSFDYRLAVDNGTGKNITLELRDRSPVSRTDQIQVELVNLSEPLAEDSYYTTQERPQGILKWWLNVPAGARGSAPFVVTYGVRVNRAKDVEITPLPE